MIAWQNHVASFTGAHQYFDPAFMLVQQVAVPVAISIINLVQREARFQVKLRRDGKFTETLTRDSRFQVKLRRDAKF